MWTELKKIFKDCLTGIDGVSYDPARIFWSMGVNVFFVISFIKDFTITEWATAFGLVLIAGAGGVLIKAPTEPKC